MTESIVLGENIEVHKITFNTEWSIKLNGTDLHLFAIFGIKSDLIYLYTSKASQTLCKESVVPQTIRELLITTPAVPLKCIQGGFQVLCRQEWENYLLISSPSVKGYSASEVLSRSPLSVKEDSDENVSDLSIDTSCEEQCSDSD